MPSREHALVPSDVYIGPADLSYALGLPPRGDNPDPLHLATCGHASGKPDPIDIINDLGARGSLFITRPAVMHYMAKREDMVAAASELFEVLASGTVKVHVNYRYPLREVAKAHAAIESGTTMGSTVLLVD
jgi:NADPH:quinone reductase-like Zn-dependent oxidoreductase